MAAAGDELLDMVAAFVLHGALNEELFFAPGVGNEMLFVFGKVAPVPEGNP